MEKKKVRRRWKEVKKGGKVEEKVKKYKPCIEVYDWAVKELQLTPQEILLVSAHPWDVAGASNAGMQSAFFKQDKQMLYPLATPPTFIFDNLSDLAQQLSALSKQTI